MTFKLSIASIALMLAFTSVYADHPFSIKGEGDDMMYVPNKVFHFTIDPGSPGYYDTDVIRILELTIGGCCRHLGMIKAADGSISIQSSSVNPWINLKERKTVDVCVYSDNAAHFCGVDEQNILSAPDCSIDYVPLSPNGYKVEIEVYGDDIPPDFELYADYVLPSADKSY